MSNVCSNCKHKFIVGEDRWCVGLHEYFCSACRKSLPPQRGGYRPGAGRPALNPSLKKQKKAFSLSPESVQALAYLQEFLGLSSQSVVVEYLVLKAFRESSKRVTEHQREIF